MQTLADFLNGLAGGEGADLLKFLNKVRIDLPTLAPAAEHWIAIANQALDPASLIEFAGKEVPEINEVLQGNFEQGDNPSSAI